MLVEGVDIRLLNNEFDLMPFYSTRYYGFVSRWQFPAFF